MNNSYDISTFRIRPEFDRKGGQSAISGVKRNNALGSNRQKFWSTASACGSGIEDMNWGS